VNNDTTLTGSEQSYTPSGSHSLFTRGFEPVLLVSSGSRVYTGSSFSGVYGWQNHVTGKWYVGESIRVPERVNYYLRADLKSQILISGSMAKHGISAFSCYKIEECSLEVLHEREVFWGTCLNSMAPTGYNLRLGGSGKSSVSDTTKNRIRDAQYNRKPITLGTRIKLSIASSGRIHTQETCRVLANNSCARWADPIYKKRVIDTMVSTMGTNEFRKSRSKKTALSYTEELRKTRSDDALKRWSDPTARKARLTKLHKTIKNRSETAHKNFILFASSLPKQFTWKYLLTRFGRSRAGYIITTLKKKGLRTDTIECGLTTYSVRTAAGE
jgi:group I intron endonuclease